jgi:hypothetical protein
MTPAPSLLHNKKLADEYIAKAGNPSRYPPISEQVELLPLDTSRLPAHAYNPSLYQSNGHTYMTYRHHVRGGFQTLIGIAELDKDGRVMKTRDLPIEGFSVEDAHLFSLHGEPWVSWVEARWEGRSANPKSVIKYAQLELPPAHENPDWKWNAIRTYQPAAGGNDWGSVQKNWVFFEQDENLFCVFLSHPQHCVWQIQGGTVIADNKTAPAQWPYGAIRGGNVVPYGNKLLRFFHSSTIHGIGQYEKRYYIGALIMEGKPPFAVQAISKRPIIYGSEAPVVDCYHFKPGVAFPCGAVVDRGSFIVALGVNDCQCALARIKPEQLNL